MIGTAQNVFLELYLLISNPNLPIVALNSKLINVARNLSLISDHCQNICLDLDNFMTADCKYYKTSDVRKLAREIGLSFSSFHLNIVFSHCSTHG